MLKSWRGLRSFARVTVCNIEDGGGEGGRRAGVCSGVSCSWETFGFPLFARGSFEARSWLQKRCRSRGGLGGAKLQAAENQRKSVLVFARRVRRERVRLLCLVSVGVGASLRRWFAWASARSLKLARTQNRGRAAAPNLGPRFLLATKSGPAPRRKAQPEGLWCCCCLECLRDSRKLQTRGAGPSFARRALVVFHYGVASAKSCN